jgi:hypothetical protein
MPSSSLDTTPAIPVANTLPFSCANMLDEESFTATEKAQIRRFQTEVQRRITENGADLSFLTMFSITQACEIDTSLAAKDGLFMVALWISLLSALSRVLTLDRLKYPTFQAFSVDAYEGKFNQEAMEEQHHLWHTANWMSILFQIIPAKKNKGLAMQVVPKLVEGWDAKYVTGSGQTKFTASRVYLFETEGNTKPSHRGRSSASGKGHAARGKKRSVAASSAGRPPKARRERSGSGDIDFHPSKRRKRRVTGSTTSSGRKSVSFGETDYADNEAIGEDGRVYSYNFIPVQSDADHDHDNEEEEFFSDEEGEDPNEPMLGDDLGETDGDEQSVNADVQTAFKSFSSLPPMPAGLNREETTSLSLPSGVELMRSDSLLNLKLPSMERDISWTEIPVNNQTSTLNNVATTAPQTTGVKKSTSCNTILTAGCNGGFDFDMLNDYFVGSAETSPRTGMAFGPLGSLSGPSPVPFAPTGSTSSSVLVSSSGNPSGGIVAVDSTSQFVQWWSAL